MMADDISDEGFVRVKNTFENRIQQHLGSNISVETTEDSLLYIKDYDTEDLPPIDVTFLYNGSEYMLVKSDRREQHFEIVETIQSRNSSE